MLFTRHRWGIVVVSGGSRTGDGATGAGSVSYAGAALGVSLAWVSRPGGRAGRKLR
jgi:hypothetical protein